MLDLDAQREELFRSERRTSMSESEPSTDSYIHIPYGFQSKALYKPKSKNREITGVTYNSRSRQFVMLDPKGVTAWSYHNVVNSVSRLLEYPSYQFNLIQLLLHSKKHSVYFGLSCDYALKVFNLNFHEVFSVVSDMNSVLCMVFNSVTDELITGGTGGVKFWSFGEIKRQESYLVTDSRPMANYGLILRFEHPGMSGCWVKDILLDESNQRLYCLSERNVFAYDLEGNFLFMLKSAHQGLVTGCVYSKYSNFVVTAGSDCAVNVWSTTGGCIHSFTSHSKTITNLLVHPQAPSLVITSSEDGTVKMFSLDIMEEIYSHVVFPEAIIWMNYISNDILYCASTKSMEVFSINHIIDFWTTVRCPLQQLGLSTSCNKSRKIIAIGEDNSTRLISKQSHLLSTVLPPPPITTSHQSIPCVSGYAYCPLYGLMYLLVNQSEIWVYYTKTNPANRVEVWYLSDVRDIKQQEIPRGRSSSPYTERSQRTASPTFSSHNNIVDDVACFSIEFLNSQIIMKSCEEQYSDIKFYLVAGLEDGRLLFLSPFSATVMYYQLQVTKGTIVSIKHDVLHTTLVLKTISLDDYSIQIRNLPDLELQYVVNVGKDITCFARMDELLISGHESGRLKLHHLFLQKSTLQHVPSGDKIRITSANKTSKDHLHVVLSVDCRSELRLFCSSSKDGFIKIWNDHKVLLRDITLDESLTMVCFLNSSGDLLAGFKNHIFFISCEKVHLVSHNKNMEIQSNSGVFETESEVYEAPRVRFEFKKTLPPEPVSMETYLVPFANISINLARYLSGNISRNAFEDVGDSDGYETESEMSDLFSIAATDVYMSRADTPVSRSRSSSMVNTWDMPKLGCSPVSSPPRTPPPVMTPVAELVSDEGFEIKGDFPLSFLPVNPDETSFQYNQRPVKEQKVQVTQIKTVPRSTAPVIPRRNRTGISQVKIDSQSLRSRQKNWKEYKNESRDENETKHENNVRHKNETRDAGNTKVENEVKYVKQMRREVKKKRRNETKRGDKAKQWDYKINKNENETKNKNDTKIGIERNKRSTVKKTQGDVVRKLREKENKENSQLEASVDNNNESGKASGLSSVTKEQRGGTPVGIDEALGTPQDMKSSISVQEDHMGISANHVHLTALSNNGVLEEEFGDTGKGNSRQNSANSRISEISNKENISNEDLSDQASSSDSDIDISTKDEKKSTLSKTVTFQDSENLNDESSSTRKNSKKNLRPQSSQRNTKYYTRGASPVNSSFKVVPVESRLLGDESNLATSSALRIYTLAKTRRQTLASGRSLDPKSKPDRPEHQNQELYDSLRQIADIGTERKTRDNNEIMGTQAIKEANDQKGREAKRDLVNWCLRALNEKGNKYPVFLPKPRLRSRRSMNLEKIKANEEEANLDQAYPRYEIEIPGTRRKVEESEVPHLLQVERSAPINEERSHRHSGEVLIKRGYSRMDTEVLGEYGLGWHERQVLRATLLKEKRLEREQMASERRRRDLGILEEKRRNLYNPANRAKTESDVMKSCSEVNTRENKPKYEDSNLGKPNDNQAISPYRLGKLDSSRNENWASFIDTDSSHLGDKLEVPVRPKSAASIPSKCRKFVLVPSELDCVQENPQILTPLEETLLLRRFPNSKIKPGTSRLRIPSAFRRPHSVAKMRTVQMPCK